MPSSASRVQIDALARLAQSPAIRAIADAAPPFTPSQVTRLRAAFRPPTGCPCGCLSKPGYWTDPDCITLKPIRPAQDWAAINGSYDLEAEVA